VRLRWRAWVGSTASTILAVGLAACGGGSKPTKPVAYRICNGSAVAASRQLHQRVHARITARNPIDLHCVLTARRLKVKVVSQTTPSAYTSFNTVVSHQEQVYGPGVHTPSQIPVNITVPGAVVAVWVRAQAEVISTSASPTKSGTYVTVTVGGQAPDARGARAKGLAITVARATFAAHPDGSRQ
jgi:hypothetical protein